MEPFRVLLADDEPPARKKLRELFAREPDFVVARECADGDETARALAVERFDLVLLDVQMPGKSGLDVVRAVGPARLPPVVFVTAFDEHALKAFELHALDYLLKPFDGERFLDMLARARREIGRASSAHAERLERLLAELERKGPPIVLRTGARRLLLDPSEVEWIEGADNYVRLHGSGTERLVRGTLSEMEALLAPHGFLRVHRSLLVNERTVRELLPRKSGELTLVLASGARLVASRSHRPAIEERWRGKRLGAELEGWVRARVRARLGDCSSDGPRGRSGRFHTTIGRVSSRTPERTTEPQTTSTVLMIRPAGFEANPETAGSNAFQRASGTSSAELLARARREFDGLVAALRANNVEVCVIDDTREPEKPDAVFPNNWVTFHAGGTVVLYPLLAPSRRREVRTDVLEELGRRGVFARRRLVDLRQRDESEGFLEGTGSLVLDRVTRVAYACLSPRTSPAMLSRFGRELGYEVLTFGAFDGRGVAIYHTNVMMSVGTSVAAACLEAIREPSERRAVEGRLAASGHELVRLDLAQVDEFAGNLLELRSRDGAALFVLSARARRALRPDQVGVLERHGRLVSTELDTIETHGGGSARCMIAEVF